MTGGVEFVSCSIEDGAADSTTGGKAGVCSVDNGVDLESGTVGAREK
jgi:hypothetical protein